MKDQNKTKAQLIAELTDTRRLISELESSEDERVKAEEALREGDERMRRLASATHEGIVFTEKGVVVEVNDQLLKILDCELSELIGKSAMEFVAPESHSLVVEKIKSGVEEPYEHLAMKKDGTIFPVEVQARMLTIQGRPLRVTAIRDITEREKAEESLRKSQILFSQAEEMNKMGYWEWDHKNYRLTSCSEQFAQIFGMTADEAVAFFSDLESEVSVVHPDDRAHYKKYLRDSEEQLEELNIEYRIINPSGEIRYVNQRGERVLDNQGEIIKSFGTVQDITERVQAEQAVQQQAQEISVLFSTGQLLAEAPPDSIEIALIMARQLVDVLGLPEASIALYDSQADTHLLRYVVDYFDPKDVPSGVENWTKKLMPMSDYPATIRAMETLEPQILQISDPDIDIAQFEFMKETDRGTLSYGREKSFHRDYRI